MSIPTLNPPVIPPNCTCGKPWNGVIPPVCPAHPPVTLVPRNWDERQYTWTGTTNTVIPAKNVLDRTQKPNPRRHTGPLKDLLIGILIGAGLMLGCFALGWLQVVLGIY